jgi:YbbR domain-containing protein
MAWRPLRNIGLKLAALALGTLLWFTVSGHQIERRVPVPVSYGNVPEPYEMTGDQVDTVNVHLRGGDTLVSALGAGDLRVVVDLASAHPGANLIPLRNDEVVAPLGIEVVQVEPSTVSVTLEKSGRRDVAVAPAVGGQPAPGYVVADVVVEPKTVTVVGPESRLTDGISVITERISLEGKTSTVVQDVSVGVADAELRVVNPRRVRVTVRIALEQAGQ